VNVLLDTNLVARMTQPGVTFSQVAHDAVDALGKRGHSPCIVPQVLHELWVVATRPKVVNGLGFTAAQAESELIRLQTLFALFPDTPAILPEWQRLVVAHQVIGRNAHDARLVAAMAVHGLTHLLTFNHADFSRYSSITVLDPTEVARASL
jgi:predicted nucleic acid-binding protein